jgi:flagellar basal body-associated protein FliL
MSIWRIITNSIWTVQKMPELQQISEQQPEAQPSTIYTNRMVHFEGDVANLYDKTKKLSDQIAENIEKNKKLNDEIEKAKRTSEWVLTITLLGFFLVLFMLGAMLIDAWKSQGTSYQDLTNKINRLYEWSAH